MSEPIETGAAARGCDVCAQQRGSGEDVPLHNGANIEELEGQRRHRYREDLLPQFGEYAGIRGKPLQRAVCIGVLPRVLREALYVSGCRDRACQVREQRCGGRRVMYAIEQHREAKVVVAALTRRHPVRIVPHRLGILRPRSDVNLVSQRRKLGVGACDVARKPPRFGHHSCLAKVWQPSNRFTQHQKAALLPCGPCQKTLQ